MAKPRRTLRYWLQQIHLWVGLILCIPLVLLGITGSVLVYGHDLDHLFGNAEPAATAAGEWQSPGAIVAAAAASAEPGRVPIAVRWPAEPGEPAAVRLSRPGMAREGGPRTEGPRAEGQRPQGQAQQGQVQRGQPVQGTVPNVSPFAGSQQILIDPVTLEKLGTSGAMSPWLRVFHDLHGNLLIPGRDGRAVVGWLGIAMLVLGVSGLVIWWPRSNGAPGQWKAAFFIRKGAKGLRLHRDLHGMVGIWSMVIFMIVSFTGVYLGFPQQTAAVINAVFPGRDMRAAMFQAKVQPLPGATPVALDDAVALALQKAPGTRFLNAFLPTRPDQALRIGLIRPDHSDGAPTVTVLVDPWRHSVIDVFDPRDYSLGESLIAWQRPLHEGLGLGPVYQLLVFLSGLIIPLFAVTGFFMWWIKRRNRRATERAKQAALRQAAGQQAE
ncbi:PepSY-associated TM helix domain-containing protein [Ferrovibrio sp.]|uniref:PepSY-associated TM helix domain-containing protein n=2 Tax=Ferrovibrio sp. TaxID=1917215 RepID=UPI0035138BA2